MTALAAIHVGKKALGLDDDTYRDLLHKVTGKRSAADLTEAERNTVLEEFRRLGFEKASKGDPKSGKRDLDGPFAGKLRALWISGFQLGVVKDRTDKALLAFLERQTGLSHTRFLRDSEDARKAIEALKAWLAREAGVDWSPRNSVPAYQCSPKFRVVEAQWRRLIEAGAVHINGDSWRTLVASVAFETGKEGFDTLDDADWSRLMAAFGRRLREAMSRKRKAA